MELRWKRTKLSCVQKSRKQNLVQNFKIPENKVVVVNNGIEVDQLREPTKDEREKAKEYYRVQGKTVCSVLGRLVPVKGHIVAIQALEKLKDMENLVFLFAGNGEKEYKEELKKEIQTYVKEHTAPYKYPRIVEFRTELPKTTSGKIIRKKL